MSFSANFAHDYSKMRKLLQHLFFSIHPSLNFTSGVISSVSKYVYAAKQYEVKINGGSSIGIPFVSFLTNNGSAINRKKLNLEQ